MTDSGAKKKENESKAEFKPLSIKKSSDLQRMKLEKLMKNYDKPVVIPEKAKDKNSPHVPDFVRNVMGSSAGAGSGEFHVYRHLRRKEYARQKYIQHKSEKEKLDDAYHQKIIDNAKAAEDKTSKKRAKRLKKKEKMKNIKKTKPNEKQVVSKEESSSSEGSDGVEDAGNEGKVGTDDKQPQS